jgi:hypothetical protein
MRNEFIGTKLQWSENAADPTHGDAITDMLLADSQRSPVVVMFE